MPTHVRASDEDIALVQRAEEDLRAEAATFSFDLVRLVARVHSEDAAQAFLQAHLYLDHVVSLLLTEAVPAPRYLQLDRTGFAQKLQLVAAMGLLPPSLFAAIRVINSIRNRIAHKLDYGVTAEDEAKLRSALPSSMNNEDDGSPVALAELLRLLVVMVDLERQERTFERTMRRRAAANARVVLDKVASTTRSPHLGSPSST